jgi:hypothetical protein
MGGSHESHTGSAGNHLCLPQHPTWNKYDDADNGKAKIYGTEYEGLTPGLFTQNLHDHNAPCAVCSTVRGKSMMLPARDECYPGWTLEYPGYLMAGHYTQHATEYVCVDGAPEVEMGDFTNEDGALLYSVEGVCGSLPCGPYIANRELTCSVCTQ